MVKTLIISATSDLSSSYLNNKRNSSEFVIIVRNIEKVRKKKFKTRFNEIICLDLNDINELSKFFDTYKNKFNKIIFFNGIDLIKPIQLYSNDDILMSFNINIISTFCIISKLLKNKSVINGSSIVIVSSISGNILGSKGHTLYSTTKAAVSGLVKSLAIELAKKKIRVNSILPGLIKTKKLLKQNQNIQTTHQFLNYESSYPLGLGNTEDINGILDFLLNKNSKWITGQNIIIDGGRSII